MIILDINRLTQALALTVLVLVGPMVLAVWGPGAFWPGVWGLWIAPLVVLFEIVLHVTLLSSQRQVRSLVPPLVVAGGLAAIRLVCAFFGAALVWGFQPGSALMSLGGHTAWFWVGSPIALALQLTIIVLMLPFCLHAWAPGFLNTRSLEQITGWKLRSLSTRQASANASEAIEKQVVPAEEISLEPLLNPSVSSAMHPFIYSFADLERYYEKVVGLEGFVILSGEGLIIWTRLPWSLESAHLAGSLSRWSLAGSLVGTHASGDLPRAALLLSDHHWLVSVPLPLGATLHLYFTESLSASKVAQTSVRLTEAARSVFAYRQGGGVPAGNDGVGVISTPNLSPEEAKSWN
jgi:hypothetical protein